MARPSLGPQLRQTLGQQQLLLPRMLQSVEVLQLATLELEGWLRAQLEENEALQLVEPRRERDSGPPGRLRSSAAGREATEAHDEMLRNQPDRSGALVHSLEEELALLEEQDQRLLEWVRFLVGCLDERGFLLPDSDTLLRLGREQGLPGDLALVERAVERLQSLEPRGIGARGPVQALLLQLDPEDPDNELLRALLCDFLEELAHNKLPAVARALSISVADLQRLLAKLSTLDSSPGSELGQELAPPLRPDLLVERDEGGLHLRLERSLLPDVRLDPAVESLARDRRQDPGVRRYLRGRLDRARWLIEALAQREATLQRVAAATFEHQRPFLEHGPGHLVPLRMSALAGELGLHVSTVSRAVAGKHVQTPWGILPLRHFFQGSGGADEDTARDDLLRAVRRLIEEEDPRAPLSDDDVVAALARRGWRVARRTVAKYRGELGIDSSYRRRRYG